MSGRPLVVVDADVLGRHRTGDETYVSQLLRELPAAAPDLRIAAITRDSSLVPSGGRVPAGFDIRMPGDPGALTRAAFDSGGENRGARVGHPGARS